MQTEVAKKTVSDSNPSMREYLQRGDSECEDWSAPEPFRYPLRTDLSYRVAKRLIDLIVSAMSLVVLFPVFVLIALAIKVTSPGPVFYHCNEVGQGGRRFVYYKFRTMVVGADKLREQLREKNEITGPFFKMKNDPRVTSIGRILRKFSLDELPQLWSVLKGDMSLVGPRPTQVFEYEQLKDWHKRRVSVKPGMICLWHLRGKAGDFDEMVKMDLKYIDNWSLWLDIKLLFGAVWYMLSGRNY